MNAIAHGCGVERKSRPVTGRSRKIERRNIFYMEGSVRHGRIIQEEAHLGSARGRYDKDINVIGLAGTQKGNRITAIRSRADN